MDAFLILGDQLFPLKHLKSFLSFPVFMAEDRELCSRYKFHKQKLTFFLSAMRHYKDVLDEKMDQVIYHKLIKKDKTDYISKLDSFVKEHKISALHSFEIEDHFMADRIKKFCKKNNLEYTPHPSPMFSCGKEKFADYLGEKKRPFMKTFYQQQRKDLDILMKDGEPHGGKYSYDVANRKKLPKDHVCPNTISFKRDSIDEEVIELVEDIFPDHVGDASSTWLGTTRKQALKQLNYFISERLQDFGAYQDAIHSKEEFMHHSLLSPYINSGLLTPEEVVKKVVQAFDDSGAPIESVEGFIRQLIGWREFVRGIYHNFSKKMNQTNFWNHKRKMKACWYTGDTGIAPLDDAIKRVVKNSYSHHIERLMIFANMMNLAEIDPKEVYKWFMEMYVDSSDWVMEANVYGMGLMSDGGIFATKPYISGSNYIIKMSNYKKSQDWCDAWDGLYWRFIENNMDFLKKNPRMGMITRSLAKMNPERRTRIFEAADKFIERTTFT